MSFTLYPFQGQAVQALRANIRRGVINQVLASPTGSGKTEIAMHLISESRARGKRAIFVADRVSLVDQTSQRLEAAGIPHGVIMADHPRWRPWERTQVASVQTLARRNWPENLDLIVVDECHALHKSTLDRLAARDTVAIGLSATPLARGLGKYYDAVVCVSTTQQLIDGGYLSPFTVYSANQPDMTGAKVVAGEWTDEVAAERSMPIIGDVVAEYLHHGQGKKAICFGCTVAHTEEMQRQFMAAGVVAELYTYRTPDAQRVQMLEEFRKPDSKIRVLISVAALARGFDVPDIHVLICARPLRSSLMEWIQMLGRGLRRDPNDPSKVCTVLDLSGNSVRFWDPMWDFFRHGVTELDDGTLKRKKPNYDEKKSTARKCPSCNHVHGARPTCPHCGYVYPRRAVRHEAGRLVQVEAALNPEGMQQFYSELIWVAKERGYNDGWAAHKFREKMGRWPNGYVQTPRMPSVETLKWIRSRQIAWAKGRAKRARMG